jgi:hypothetical protein
MPRSEKQTLASLLDLDLASHSTGSGSFAVDFAREAVFSRLSMAAWETESVGSTSALIVSW